MLCYYRYSLDLLISKCRTPTINLKFVHNYLKIKQKKPDRNRASSYRFVFKSHVYWGREFYKTHIWILDDSRADFGKKEDEEQAKNRLKNLVFLLL